MSDGVSICLNTATYAPLAGGVAVAAQRLARNLAQAGYRVHVLTLLDTPGSSGEVEPNMEDGAVVHRYRFDLTANPMRASVDYCKAIRRLDDDVGFRLFHGFFLTAVFPCLNVAQRRKPYRPVIASIRGSDVSTLLDQPLSRSTILPGLARAAWITSVNQLYLERVAEEVDINGRASVIRNGVASPQGQLWRLDERNRGTVGTVGEFRRAKDIPLLVRAYAAVAPRLRKRLLLAGYFCDSAEEAWTRTLIDEFALQDQMEVTGQFAHAEVERHLSAMHVYVQSSAYEGLPNALLEAASLGVPLVATNVGGMGEVLLDGDTALLAPHGEPQMLSDAIARVLGDDGLAIRLSDGARRLAARLSPEKERDDWLALYRRLLESH